MSDRDAAADVRPAAAPRENPYVGLIPFAERDAGWFFGRDTERRIIAANLRSSRLTLLYGASGVGKSSLLMAAVLPDLRAVVARDRVAREADDAAQRRPVRFAVAGFASWRDAPLDGLMTAVAAAVHDASGQSPPPWVPGTPLRETFATWLGSVRSLLIVLDQFEEYFLYHPRDDGPGTFAGEFVEVVNDPRLRVSFLLSLREDELAKLDRFQGRVPRLFDNYLRVDHLDLAAGRLAIEGPKDEYNRRLPAGATPAEIDSDLIDVVLGEVRTREPVADGPRGPSAEAVEAAAGIEARVETPLLQLVMARLWEAEASDDAPPHLRLSTLRDKLGGTEKIVYRHLEEALEALAVADCELVVDLLRPLVSPTGTKIAWRATDLGYWAKRPAADIEPILLDLSRGRRRILRSVAPPPTQADQSPSFEIFHDVLAEPILEWCAAQDAERQRAELARERVESERRRRRRRRGRTLRAVAFALVSLTLVVAYVALRRSEVADSRGLAASAISQLPFDPERSLLLVMQAMQRRDTTAAEQALRLSLAQSRVRAMLGAGRPRPCVACASLETPVSGAAATAVEPLAIAPDGRTVAGVVGGTLRLWRPRTGATFTPGIDVGAPAGVAFTADAVRLLVVGQKAAVLMAPDGTRAIRLAGHYQSGATSPDGRYVATVGTSGAAVWDARTGRCLARLRDAYRVAAFAASGRLVLQDEFGELVVWRWRSARPRSLARPDHPNLLMRFSAAGGFAVDSAAGGRARVVDSHGNVQRLPSGGRSDPIDTAYISPDGSRIATVRGTTVDLWRSARPWSAPAQLVAKLIHADGVNAVVFSPDSALVATASSDGTARVWESSTGGLVAELRGHVAVVQWLAFSARGRFLATVAEDLTVRLWDLGVERTLRGARGVDAIAAPNSGSRVAVVEAGGALRLWDVRRPTATVVDPRRALVPADRPAADELRALDLHATSIAITADDRSLLVGYETVYKDRGRAALLDAASGRVRVSVDGSGPVQQVAVDRRGRLAAIVRGQDDGTSVELWDLGQGRDARHLWQVPVKRVEQLTDAAFSPDGRRLLVTSLYGAARIFDVRSHTQLHALATGRAAKPGPEPFYRGVFSPDGATVAVAGSRDVRLWDSATGRERDVRLSGHTSVLHSVAYSPDGRRIVTTSADGTTRVWDARTGIMLDVIARHSGPVNSAMFLPNGWIVSAGDDRTVRAYPCETCATTDTLLALAGRRVTRDLSPREHDEFVK